MLKVIKAAIKLQAFVKSEAIYFINERKYTDTVSYIVTSLPFLLPLYYTCNFSEKELHHRNSLITFAKFFRTGILQNIFEQVHSFQRSQEILHVVLFTQVLIGNSQHR